MSITTEIAVNDSLWQQHENVINQDFFNKVIVHIITKYPHIQKKNSIELSVLLTNNEEIRALNKEFRNKNKPTNVLSFPEYEDKLYDLEDAEENIFLGDIAFALEKIEQEAEENSVNFIDHFTHLTIHAILHLLGHDHMNDHDAELMESLEIEILEQYNIKSPYTHNYALETKKA
ncbi:MAG: hypothetical protein DGJ47_000138 [Rickettsiaceae bacterium]